MEGQVFVPYTGIGGFNMNNGLMMLAIGGSSQDSELTGDRDQTWNVLWSFPGGITNIKNRPAEYQGGEWGYLLGAAADTEIVTDEILIADLQGKYGINAVDNDGNIQAGYESTIQAYINDLLYIYVSRAMQGLGDLSWDAFRDYFGLGTCVIYLG